jgi:hypothetical protein
MSNWTYKDIFSNLRVGTPLFSALTVDFTGAIGDVLNRKDLYDPDGALVGFIVTAHAIAVGTPAANIELQLWESDEITDPQTLTAPTQVDDEYIHGYAMNGSRAVIPNPAYDTSLPPYIQDDRVNLPGPVLPKLDDAAGQADSSFWFQYIGNAEYVQLYSLQTTTGAAVLTCTPVYSSHSMHNMVNPPPQGEG